MKPAKFREELRQALSIYPHPSVPHVHHQELVILVVAHLDVNAALGREFERVLQQVYHHLLETLFVANQERQITVSICYQQLVAAWLDLVVVLRETIVAYTVVHL